MPILSARVNLHKRHSAEQQAGRHSAATIALCRIYCDVLRLWRGCADGRCKRHRHCGGDAWPCLQRGKSTVPAGLRERIHDEVRAGGPSRMPPINNLEAAMRRNPPGWL